MDAWLEKAVGRRLKLWRDQSVVSRLRKGDWSLWRPEPFPEANNRLGWLGLPSASLRELPKLRSTMTPVLKKEADLLVLLGMGGSMLGAKVLCSILRDGPNPKKFVALDTTHPDAVASVEQLIENSRPFFLACSKSGTTAETVSLEEYFFRWASRRFSRPGELFGVITDPGTPMERRARERGYSMVVSGKEDVGGRYSVLSVFGLVPAILVGKEGLEELLEGAVELEKAEDGDPKLDPYLETAAACSEAVIGGEVFLELRAQDAVCTFSDWLEQLVAESSGKDGKGIVPVKKVEGGEGNRVGVCADGWCRSVVMGDPSVLGRELYGMELMTALSCSVLGVNPFDQPDVQSAKELARRVMKEGLGGIEVRKVEWEAAANWLKEGDYLYVALLAFVDPSREELVRSLAARLEQRLGKPVLPHIGPRYLHSVGQLFKGGLSGGAFVVLIEEPSSKLEGELGVGLAKLIKAQAIGDAAALSSYGRPTVVVELEPGRLESLSSS